MKFIKVLAFALCMCILVGALTSCTNNLVNQWEDYTADSDVYYEATPTITEIKKVLKERNIPEYWANDLKAAVEESTAKINAAEDNYSAFIWYSDAHWSYSARRSIDLIKFLQDYTNVRFVNFGGDIVSNNNRVEHSEIVAQLKSWRDETLKLSDHHSVVGNHDDDIPELKDKKDLYDFLLKDEEGKTTDTNNKFCYYVDNAAEKTRYIYLSTGFDETTADDLRFLVNTLDNTQKDWHIVVVSHIWFVYNDTNTPTEGSVPEFAQPIFEILDAYNARTSGKTKSIDYNFASAGARVEFCIGGHTHVDFDFRTDGGIPVILNETDSYHLRGGNKDIDETDEASVSVIVANYDMNIIYVIRAGRGEGRTVDIQN